jgi:plastocyanin
MKTACVWLLVAGAVLSAACSDGEPTVGMTGDRAFEPKSITVSAGETVTWTNDSSDAHTVTAEEASLPEGANYFASGGATSEEAATDGVADGLLTEGETFSVTFDEPGTYRYYCIPHLSEGMTGTVIVKE